MHVLADGGRSIELADNLSEFSTVGALAASLTRASSDTARQFSLKIDGVPAHPSEPLGGGFLGDPVLELIEVTDHDWSVPVEATAVQQTESTAHVDDLHEDDELDDDE